MKFFEFLTGNYFVGKIFSNHTYNVLLKSFCLFVESKKEYYNAIVYSCCPVAFLIMK
jgi:hypothetical protein